MNFCLGRREVDGCRFPNHQAVLKMAAGQIMSLKYIPLKKKNIFQMVNLESPWLIVRVTVCVICVSDPLSVIPIYQEESSS